MMGWCRRSVRWESRETQTHATVCVVGGGIARSSKPLLAVRQPQRLS